MGKDNNPKSVGNANETSTTEKTTRSKIGRNNEYIRDFLMSAGRYEADAIRVLLIAVNTDINIGTLALEDQIVINCYLIDGLYKGECNSVDSMKAYRQDKAAELMGAVGEYLETRQQTIAVTKFLMKFASDNTMAQQAMNSLIARPADTKATGVASSSAASQQGQGVQSAPATQQNGYQNGSKQ